MSEYAEGILIKCVRHPECLRLVRVRGVTGEILLLATNLSAETITAADLALLYKQR